MRRTQRLGLFWLLLSIGISIVWGIVLEHSPSGMADFKAIYYGAQCLIQHSDPYKEGNFLRVYRADGGTFPSETEDPVKARMFRRCVPVCINLPTALFIVSSFTILGWGVAHILWTLLFLGGFILAAILMWDLAGNHSPGLSLFLICIVLANSELIFGFGNIAGITLSLCLIAVWCFLKERFVLAGVLCLAVSLTLKPHDVGLVWLYFLLAGGIYRKRALQTLIVVAVISLPAILWVSHVAPHWIEELHSNLAVTSERGDLNDPGPASLSRPGPGIIDLQAVVSVFRDDPLIYKPVSYLICGALLAIWSITTLKSRFSQHGAWFALAAIAALSMLPVYHRQYDTKLLLLAVPACAMLWAEGGRIRWLALLVTTAGVVLTGDIPLAILTLITNHLHMSTAGIWEQMATVVLMRPAPLVLLAMSIFYLWMYVRRSTFDTGSGLNRATATRIEPGTELG